MIRFGIIGTNWITESFLRAAGGEAEFRLEAVCSRTEERAREFAAKHGARLTFTDAGAMAASVEVDAVYIASPNRFHAEQAIACLERGVHVLCEKPLASNAREVRAMAEAASRGGAVLMEAMKSTLMPNFRAIRDTLPTIGRVRRFFANYCQYSSRYDAYRRGELPNAFNPAFSNGAMMDLGVYCLYPAIALFGKPLDVKANALLLPSGVDGEGSLILKYEDMEAVAQYSKIANSYAPSEIQGEEGCILIDRIGQPERVEARYRDGRTIDVSARQEPEDMVYELREFIGLIGRGAGAQSDVNSLDHSLAVMEVMDEARRQIGLKYPADES